MDPITVSIIIILGKYALDKGVELGKSVGPDALKTAQAMFKMVLERVGKKKPEMAAEYTGDPETYQKPMEKALDAQVAVDQEFAAQLKALLDQYDQAAQAHARASGQVYTATAGANSIIAQGGSAVSTGGVAVAGNVQGGIHASQPEKKG